MNKKSIVSSKITIKEALSIIDSLAGNTLFATNDDGHLVGTLTDGDIRRGLINGVSIENSVDNVMSTTFKYLLKNEFKLHEVKEIKKSGIEFLPILNHDKKIINIYDLRKLKTILPLEAIIMAGGKGTRLAPLTLEKPKPMLKVGNKPIIEHNIDYLIKFGVTKIYISVNYLKEHIINYFGNGSSKGISIEYIEENEITGTLGSSTYVEKYNSKDLLVMNSDILTNINLEDFYASYLDAKGDMAVASVPYQVTIPYGVLETKNGFITSLKEKPAYTHYSNAGIYIIKASCIREIPQKTFYNATDLIEKLISENRQVVNYPIRNYWLDIGKPIDFEKAQEDIKHIKL